MIVRAMHSDAFLIKSYQIYQDRESLNIILFDLIHVEHCGTVWQKDEKHEALMKILETVQHQSWACNILYTVIIRLFWQSSMGFNDQRAVHLFLNSQLPQPPSNWDVAPKKIKVAKDKHKRIHLLISFCGKLPSAICGFLTSVKPGFSVVSSGGPSDNLSKMEPLGPPISQLLQLLLHPARHPHAALALVQLPGGDFKGGPKAEGISHHAMAWYGQVSCGNGLFAY